jgi:hypothetical protein
MKRALLVSLVVGLMALETGITLRAQYVYQLATSCCNGGGGNVGDSFVLSCTWKVLESGIEYSGTKTWGMQDWDNPAPMSDTFCTGGTNYVICVQSNVPNGCTWVYNYYTCSDMTSTLLTSAMSTFLITVPYAY